MDQSSTKIYDLIIIGTGPTGYTASIYASRFKLSNLVIGRMPGGTMTEAHKICNFPGYNNISGMELGQKMQQHAMEIGGEEKIDLSGHIKKLDDGKFEVDTNSGDKFIARTVLIATGTKRRKLGLDQEKALTGKGVSYCAACDAGLYKDKIVAVNGGADAANSASVLLAQHAKKVIQVYRRSKLRGDQTWVHEVNNNPKIEVIYNTHITKLIGSDKLEAIELDKEYNGSNKIKVDGLFIEIGAGPASDIAKDLGCDLDEEGYIKVGKDQMSSIEGVWAAGDVTDSSNEFRQIITGCAEGSIAVDSVFKYLKSESNS